MIRVVCGCGRVFKAEVRHSGKRTRCPACGTDLIIGQTPSSGSSEAELGDVPSWWYPNDPAEPIATDKPPSGRSGDPEATPTAVLEHHPAAQGGESLDLEAERRRSRRPRHGPVRSLWTLAGVIAATAALGLGMICWILGTVPFPLNLAAAWLPQAGGAGGDAGRGHGAVVGPDRGGQPAGDGGSPLPGAIRVGTPRPLHLAGRAEGLVGEGPPARPARRLRLLVPAYIYPSGDGRLQWRRLMDAAAKVDLVAVVNPDSGPGVERNSDYAALIAEAANRGVNLVGYISTEYAARPASMVKKDIDAWLRFYPRIGGIFLDQQPADARHAPYLADISAYAREKFRDAIVISNPGVPCDETYMARRTSDLVCVFANFEGFPTFDLPANLRSYEPTHFAALVYQVADVETMRSMLTDAIIKRLGYICITDGKRPNPWSRLPAYWDAEIEALARLQ